MNSTAICVCVCVFIFIFARLTSFYDRFGRCDTKILLFRTFVDSRSMRLTILCVAKMPLLDMKIENEANKADTKTINNFVRWFIDMNRNKIWFSFLCFAASFLSVKICAFFLLFLGGCFWFVGRGKMSLRMNMWLNSFFACEQDQRDLVSFMMW